MVELHIEYKDFKQLKCEVLAIPFFKDNVKEVTEEMGLSKEEADSFYDYLGKYVERTKSSKIPIIDSPTFLKVKKLLLLNLEDVETNLFCIKERFASAAKLVEKLAIESSSFFFTQSIIEQKFEEAALDGLLLSDYRFKKFKKNERYKNEITVVTSSKKTLKSLQEKLKSAKKIKEVVFRIRDHVNEPSNTLTPEEFRDRCLELRKMRDIDVKVMDKGNLENEGLNCLLAVGRGSKNGSMLVLVEYKPKNPLRKVAMLGKGVIFDTGGYSLKNPRQILNMKGDMLGAATVVETIRFAAINASPVEIIGLLPIAENLVNELAFRPDDVLKAYNGKTVEITSTDAEGRLLLADALSYAKNYKPDEMLSVATISGSCYFAFGELLAPYSSNSEKLSEMFECAASVTGESFTRVPLLNEYKRFLKSDIADMQNAPLGGGGSLITAPLFLSEFVANNLPWIHVDLAGVDYHEKEVSSLYPKGSTAYGAKTILKYLDLI